MLMTSAVPDKTIEGINRRFLNPPFFRWPEGDLRE
jgi:hypothetical protein